MKNKRYILLALAIFAFALSAAAQGKYALIIGNDDYRGNDFKPMTCCVNDANAMARCISDLGYDTIVVRNADFYSMADAIELLEGRIKSKDDIAVFYFSGHGVEIDREQYLLPANTELKKNSANLRRRGVSLGDIEKELKDTMFAEVFGRRPSMV